MVWGVWADPTAAHGVDATLIKGHERLLLISEGRPIDMSVAAVPCRNFEQAEAMRLVFVDGGPNN
jgi:hypothetical protein